MRKFHLIKKIDEREKKERKKSERKAKEKKSKQNKKDRKVLFFLGCVGISPK
jgi:hypothetical protein